VNFVGLHCSLSCVFYGSLGSSRDGGVSISLLMLVPYSVYLVICATPQFCGSGPSYVFFYRFCEFLYVRAHAQSIAEYFVM